MVTPRCYGCQMYAWPRLSLGLTAGPTVVCQAACAINCALTLLGPDVAQAMGRQHMRVLRVLLHAPLAIATELAMIVVTLNEAARRGHAVNVPWAAGLLHTGAVGSVVAIVAVVAARLAYSIQQDQPAQHSRRVCAVVAVPIGRRWRGRRRDSRESESDSQNAGGHCFGEVAKHHLVPLFSFA